MFAPSETLRHNPGEYIFGGPLPRGSFLISAKFLFAENIHSEASDESWPF